MFTIIRILKTIKCVNFNFVAYKLNELYRFKVRQTKKHTVLCHIALLFLPRNFMHF